MCSIFVSSGPLTNLQTYKLTNLQALSRLQVILASFRKRLPNLQIYKLTSILSAPGHPQRRFLTNLQTYKLTSILSAPAILSSASDKFTNLQTYKHPLGSSLFSPLEKSYVFLLHLFFVSVSHSSRRGSLFLSLKPSCKFVSL